MGLLLFGVPQIGLTIVDWKAIRRGRSTVNGIPNRKGHGSTWLMEVFLCLAVLITPFSDCLAEGYKFEIGEIEGDHCK
jgi:hypothetical protein